MNTARIRTFLFAVFTALCVMLGTPGIVPAWTGSSPLVWTAVSAAGFRKCYTITDRNTPVYSDTGLTHKIGEIFPEDEIIVNNVTGQYVDATYPISSGWKRGYISPSAILLDVNGQGTRTASGRMTTYKRNSTSATYGNVDPGDVCLILGTSNNMVQIKYPVSGGYKYAFITAEDARNCLGYGDTQPAPSSTDAGTSTYIVKANGGLNLRSGPSTSHSSLGIIPNGSQVSVSSISNGWAAVTWNGRSGYSSAQYLSKSESSPAPSPQPVSGWSYPMSNAYVCGNNWGTYYRARPYRPYHAGLDLASRTGDANVYAASSGTVAAKGWNSANGNYIILQHTLSGRTVYSFYCHLNSINVSNGQSVDKGSKIGVFGNTGTSSAGRHLHFAITDRLVANGGYFGYITQSSGNARYYSGDGVTYYNPAYVIQYNQLP